MITRWATEMNKMKHISLICLLSILMFAYNYGELGHSFSFY